MENNKIEPLEIRVQKKEEFKRKKRELKAEFKSVKRDFKQKIRAEKNVYKQKKKELKIEYAPYKFVETDSSRYQSAPKRVLLEEIGNAISHGFGSVFAIVAFVIMMIASDNGAEYFAGVVYSLGLFVLYTISSLYHSFKYGTLVKRIFRMFDYTSIYFLIGATFAPLLLCYLGGTFGIVFFIIQWLAIITGVTLVAVFGPSHLKFIHFPLYFLIGWSALLFIPKMINGDIHLLIWILGGGVVYTLGIIPFAIDKKSSHFIWHLFVLAGSIIQWIGIYLYVYLA